ncbi:FG-GAP repeat protein [Haloarcula sediminis]|uniref:FG-GAP repeat protein n=1 Tax=Haloarcula sediminis TaxID=3111777 RepID=UPI002D78B15F|nr:FG-GAP repeat protein [Haloarcula sp. CK38]
MTTHRRQFIGSCVAAGIGVLAGCSTSSEDSSESPTDSRPTETTTPVQSPTETLASTTPTPSTPDGDDSSTSPQPKLSADDVNGTTLFGGSVAVSNDGATALAGATWDSTNGRMAGAAYVFERSDGSWSQQAKLLSDDTDSRDYFGKSVALSNDGSLAIVGANSDDDPHGDGGGAAYVFARSDGSWDQQGKLAADDGTGGVKASSSGNDHFGESVAMSGDGGIALVAAPDENENGTAAGAAYAFERSDGSWSQQAKLLADDGSRIDQFGSSVGLSRDGSRALIGASHDSNGAGSAYIFARSDGSWSQQTKIAADDGDSDDQFGCSVAMSDDGEHAFVGAKYDRATASDAGSAYVFERSGGAWRQRAKLTADDGDSEDHFGTSVDISGDGSTLLTGAYGDEDPHGEEAGSAYVFERSDGSWSQQAKLVAGDGESEDEFGGSVALSGDGSLGLVGAKWDNDPVRHAGSAYVFDI